MQRGSPGAGWLDLLSYPSRPNVWPAEMATGLLLPPAARRDTGPVAPWNCSRRGLLCRRPEAGFCVARLRHVSFIRAGVAVLCHLCALADILFFRTSPMVWISESLLIALPLRTAGPVQPVCIKPPCELWSPSKLWYNLVKRFICGFGFVVFWLFVFFFFLKT